ncbi:MAG TPA: hypothetical protein DCP63_04170 [Bacteroidetes bacterium]|nr:hypothetical protein [Bacteroidota bacterium]
MSSPRFIGIAAGMAVGSHSATSLNDYINGAARPRLDQQVGEFSTVVEFFVVPEVQITEDVSAELEYSLMLKSYSFDDRGGFSRSEFAYQVHLPSLTLHYLDIGEGYRLKFGGGLGYHFGRLSQSFAVFGGEEVFKASGLGIKLDAVGQTQLDETLYGVLGVDVRWDFLGSMRRGDGTDVIDRTTDSAVRMSFFSFGLKMGILFRLN